MLDAIAADLLDVVVSALGDDAPERQVTTWGEIPDDVGEGCTGQVTVAWRSLRASGTATNQQTPGPHAPKMPVQPVAVYRVRAVFCVADMDDAGNPPASDAVADDLSLIADAAARVWCAMRAAVATVFGGCSSVSFTELVAVGPGGKLGGFEFDVAATVDALCREVGS